MAAVAITMSDVVVFGPIAFLTGIVGQFFKQFGLTVVFATLFSLLVSFTLTPMLASLLFNNVPGRKENTSDDKAERSKWAYYQHQVYVKYQAFLEWALSHRRPVVITCLLAPMLVFSFLPLGIIKTEFMPQTDQSKVTISLEMPPGTSLKETDAVLAKLEQRAMKLPEVESVYSTVGKNAEFVGTTVSAQQGNVAIRLVPKRIGTVINGK
jgi:HAE1 family hydrophobic/amphiphilic exporter-1